MTNNLKIGITGGIGSGKSVVCRIFKILGAPVYDADVRAKFILNNDPDIKSEILTLFGPRAYTSKGLDNEWIAGHVFGDQQKLHQLNQLVHPKVGMDFDIWMKQFDKTPYIIKEAALLFESGSYKNLDKIIVVAAPEELRIRRVLKRDTHRTPDQIKDIINRQWPEDKKIKKADYIINNDEESMIVPQILGLHNEFLRLSPGILAD